MVPAQVGHERRYLKAFTGLLTCRNSNARYPGCCSVPTEVEPERGVFPADRPLGRAHRLVLPDRTWRKRSRVQVSDEDAAAMLDQEPEGVVPGQDGVLPIGNAAVAHLK